ARLVKARRLLRGKAIARRLVGRGEVRHQAGHAQVRTTAQGARDLACRFRSHAEPAHACVNLDVDIGDNARGPRRRVKRLRCFETEQSRHEPLAQTQLSLSGPETFETENGLLDT